jgi:hypothetical protein
LWRALGESSTDPAIGLKLGAGVCHGFWRSVAAARMDRSPRGASI